MTNSHNIQNTWSAFLMDAELARNYNAVAMFAGGGHLPAPNPILESLLPSLLYMRLVSLLDDALKEFIKASGMSKGKAAGNGFNGRIDFLDQQGRLRDGAKLHALRHKRNELAHEASQSCNWSDLDDAINIADVELRNLGLVGPKPKYEFYAERNRSNAAQPGIFVSNDYCYGLKLNGDWVSKVSWTVHHHLPAFPL